MPASTLRPRRVPSRRRGPLAVGPLAAGALVLVLALGASGCRGDTADLSSWCGLVAAGDFVPLDAPDAPEAWGRLEESAPADVAADVERIRVAAEQVSRLAPDDVSSAAQLALTPRVLAAHSRVVDVIRSRCRIDVTDMSVIESAVT